MENRLDLLILRDIYCTLFCKCLRKTIGNTAWLNAMWMNSYTFLEKNDYVFESDKIQFIEVFC